MAYKIAVASGKGGTGKTTVSLMLQRVLAASFQNSVLLVDCDVEEPNDLLFYPDASLVKTVEVTQQVPVIDESKCIFCRKCESYCEFNAIGIIPTRKYAKVDDSLCHSCGACLVACESDAITEKTKVIGQVQHYDTGYGLGISEGRLKVGSSMQTMMIKELKRHVTEDPDIVIFDAPPGTSCQVVETVSDSDFVILVTEPTPFGLHDLKLMLELMKEMDKPFGVVINKAGLGDDLLGRYLEEEHVPILSELPFDKEFASHYASGDIFEYISNSFVQGYEKLKTAVEEKVLINEGANNIKW